MDEKSLHGLIGLCVRAGHGIFGEDSCLKALRSGQAELLLMDGDISNNSAERYRRICQQGDIPFFTLPAGLLAKATGKPGKAMAVRTGNFSGQIKALLK